MPHFTIDGTMYAYSVQRQNRKTLQLQILAAFVLLIKAPLRLGQEEIHRFLHDKANWIQEKTAMLQVAKKENPAGSLTDGSVLPFRGTELTLDISASFCKPAVRLDERRLCVSLYAPEAERLPDLLKKWYVKQAVRILSEKTEFWRAKLDVQVNRIAIKEQKTRWGSCSSLGNINYNWRIIMAPEDTIDYLVIHEVAHRIYLNHSKEFWALVEAHCPGFRLHRLWLKRHGRKLFEIL